LKNKLEIFKEERLFHVYNRANGNEKLFLSDENYRYFLRKFDEYISPFVDTFCYCLMPNHFHFLLKIKRQEQIENVIKYKNLNKNLDGLISQQFSNFFNSYAKAFNKQQNRKGSLFMHTFKRKQINDEKYLRKLIHYIHYNPKKAGLVNKLEDWDYSSYRVLISELETKLKRKDALELFESRSNFIYCHKHA